MKTLTDLTSRFLAALALGLCLTLGVGGSAAMAEPTGAQINQAKEDGATAGANYVCNDLLKVGNAKFIGKQCKSLAKKGIETVDGKFGSLTATAICGPLAAVPTVGPTCTSAVKGSIETVQKTSQKAYDKTISSVEKGATGVVDKATAVKKFVTDPSSALEEVTNTVHDGAVDLLNKVMGQIVNIGNPDFGAKWWRNCYAAAGGIGVIVAAFMMMFLLRDAAREKVSSHQLNEGIEYLVGGFVAMVFAPPIAFVFQSSIASLNQGIVDWGGEDLYEVVLKGGIFSMVAQTTPGGVLMGLFFFLMLFLCALLVFIMFIAQGMAAYLVSIAMAIGFGMLAHPKWRSKALALPLMVIGIILSKPLMLFVLTCLFKMIDSFDPLKLVSSDALATLGNGVMILLALATIGLAPWTAFKLMPLLPTGSEIDGGGGNPAAAMAGGVAGAMMTKVAMDKMSSSGGGGGGNSGGGGESPAGKSSSTMSSAPKAPQPGGGGPGGAGQSGGSQAGALGGAGKTGAGAAGKAGAGGAAGGGAGAGATAVGGAATGGALLVAAAAAKTAGAGLNAAKGAAESAAPASQGPTQEERQDSQHDRRKFGE